MIHSLRIKIILIIFSTVVVLTAIFLSIGTTFNSKLYRTWVEKDIFSTVKLSVNEVDRYTQAMEQKVADLARAGEIFYKVRQSTSNKNLDTEMSEYLVDSFSLFPQAIGGGVWYEPYTFYPKQKYYGPYAFWDKGKVIFTWDLNTPKYDYLTQGWYTLAIPPDWDRTQKRERDYYWTPPYFDDTGTLMLMITVDAFMHNKDGAIIGISTADWSLENMLTFLKNSKISEDSGTFLVDANSNTILANTFNPESAMKNVSYVSWMSLLIDPQKDVVKIATIDIDNVAYYAYYTLTDAGMFYGTLVPSSVISKETRRLLIIGITASALFVLLLVVVLYFALSTITNSILSLTRAVSHVAEGDLSMRTEITSKDEVGLLSSGFNKMVEMISLQKQALEKRTSNLEGTVTEKTDELQIKVSELEKMNKMMVGRELKMIELKKEIESLKTKIGGV